MAVAYGTTGTWRADTNPTATSAAFAVPASVAAGDLIFVHFRHNPATAVIGTITPPTGFLNVMGPGTNTPVARVTGSAGGQDRDYFCFWKRATGADSGTYSFSWSGGTSIVPGVAIRYTGAAATGMGVDGVPGSSTHITATTTRGPCSTAPNTTNTLIIWCDTNQNTSGGDTPPASFSANRSGSQGQFACFDKAQAAAGTTGNLSGSTASSQGVSYCLAIPITPVPGIREALFSGSNTNGTNTTAAIGAGTEVGDTVYVVHLDDFYTAAAMTAPTATNYTFNQQGSTVDMGSSHCHVKVWSSPVTVAGAATITCHSTQTDQERYMATFVLMGANEIPDAIGGSGSASGVTPWSLPAISPVNIGDLLIGCWGGVENTAGTIGTFTNGMVQRGTTTNIANIEVAASATKMLAASGSTGACAVTPGPGAAEWAGVLFAVTSAASPAAANPGLMLPMGLGHHMQQQDNGLYAPSKKIWSMDPKKRREILLADDHRARELILA